MVLHPLSRQGKLSLNFHSTTRSLEVLFDGCINREMLLEFKQLLEWSFDKIEIATLVFKPRHLNAIELGGHQIKQCSAPQIMELRQLCFDINLLFLKSPQTIIVDSALGLKTWAIDLFIAADIFTGHRSGVTQLNYAQQGIMPFTCHLLSNSGIQNSGLFLGASVSHLDLTANLLWRELYDDSDREYRLRQLCQQVAKQRPITRIQSKLLLRHQNMNQFEIAFAADRSIFLAALSAQEWLLEDGVDLPQYLKNFKQALREMTTEDNHGLIANKPEAQIIPFRKRKSSEASFSS